MASSFCESCSTAPTLIPALLSSSLKLASLYPVSFKIRSCRCTSFSSYFQRASSSSRNALSCVLKRAMGFCMFIFLDSMKFCLCSAAPLLSFLQWNNQTALAMQAVDLILQLQTPNQVWLAMNNHKPLYPLCARAGRLSHISPSADMAGIFPPTFGGEN